MAFYGSSFIADQTGALVVQADRKTEGFHTHRSTSTRSPSSATGGVFRDRRPEMWRASHLGRSPQVHDDKGTLTDGTDHARDAARGRRIRDARWMGRTRPCGCWPYRTDIRRGFRPSAQRNYAAVAEATAALCPSWACRKAGSRKPRAILPRPSRSCLESDDAWVMLGPTSRHQRPGRAARRRLDLQRVGRPQGRPLLSVGQGRAGRLADLRPPQVQALPGRDRRRGRRHRYHGDGTCLVTEEVHLNPDRNPALTKSQIEDFLRDYMNVDKVLWLPLGVYKDETSGHIDDVLLRPFRRSTSTPRRTTRRTPHTSGQRRRSRCWNRETDAKRYAAQDQQDPSAGAVLHHQGGSRDHPGESGMDLPRRRASHGRLRQLPHHQRAGHPSATRPEHRRAGAQADAGRSSPSTTSSGCRRARSCSAAATSIASRSRYRPASFKSPRAFDTPWRRSRAAREEQERGAAYFRRPRPRRSDERDDHPGSGGRGRHGTGASRLSLENTDPIQMGFWTRTASGAPPEYLVPLRKHVAAKEGGGRADPLIPAVRDFKAWGYGRRRLPHVGQRDDRAGQRLCCGAARSDQEGDLGGRRRDLDRRLRQPVRDPERDRHNLALVQHDRAGRHADERVPRCRDGDAGRRLALFHDMAFNRRFKIVLDAWNIPESSASLTSSTSAIPRSRGRGYPRPRPRPACGRDGPRSGKSPDTATISGTPSSSANSSTARARSRAIRRPRSPSAARPPLEA